MTQPLRLVAVDLGATSGRVMAAVVGPDRLELTEVHRFPNGGVRIGNELVWDVVGIHREVLAGIKQVAATGPVHGIGIDSWAVDYGLLDADGRLLGNPLSHRDERTVGIADRVRTIVPDAELYGVTGLQELPFNTIYQLVSAAGSTALDGARTMLLLPDLLSFWLTGEVGAERTNASTTGLYDATQREWSWELITKVGIRAEIMPPLRDAGDRIGWVSPGIGVELGLDGSVPVLAVASHDTASAVVGVPAEISNFAYISSGTWSLVGLELPSPVLSDAAREADFTNEAGVDGTVRFLKNVMGLWVLSECLRSWRERRAVEVELPTLLDSAAGEPALRSVVDINDPSLLGPSTVLDPMPERILALAAASGEPLPESPVAIVRCVLDSLALAYRRNIRTASELAGQPVEVVHVVGGGSNNTLLCQLTADACGVPVLAGPGEAAALGNALVQARGLGADLPDLAAMRALIRATHDLVRYEPQAGSNWDAAERRLRQG